MNAPYWVLLAAMCVAAGCAIAMLNKKSLVDKSRRWPQLMMLLLTIGLSALLIATAAEPLKVSLCVGSLMLVVLIVRYPNLRVWYSLSWRSADRWRAKDAQRVVGFFTRRGWPVEMNSDIYPEPSEHNDGHGMFKIFVTFRMPGDEWAGRVWCMANYYEWARVMLMPGLTTEDEVQLYVCAQQGCQLSVRVEDDRVLGVSHTSNTEHRHE